MNRPTKQRYRCSDLEELARELFFVPAEFQGDQIRRIEALHDILDPESNYPLDFLKFRITGQRYTQEGQPFLVGEAVLADLRLIIESLSRSAPVSLLEGEQARLPEDLAKALNISTRTLARWRKLGLRVRWVKLPDSGRIAQVIPQDAWEAFSAKHASRITQASQLTRLTSDQRIDLLDQARRLAAKRHLTLNQTARHLANQTHRALETIRQILLQHDEQNPQDTIFKTHRGPLTPRQQEVIARACRLGIPITKIAKRFHKTPSTIYRAIRQRRASELRKMDISYIFASTFTREDADQVILRPVHLSSTAKESKSTSHSAAKMPVELSEKLRTLYAKSGMTSAVADRLFFQFNYLKYKTVQLRNQLDRYEPSVGQLDELDALLVDIQKRRDDLIKAHLYVVLSIAQRQMMNHPAISVMALMNLLEQGNQVLFEAVELFDPSKDQSFTRFTEYRLQKRFVQIDFEAVKAHRKLTDEQALKRLIDQAQQAGICLIAAE